MRELVRAIASQIGGYVRWSIDGRVDGMATICDAVDDFLLNRPGYRVTVIVERDEVPVVIASRPAALQASGEAV